MELIALVLFAVFLWVPTGLVYPWVFKRAVRKGQPRTGAAWTATLTSMALNGLLGFLFGLAVFLAAFLINDPAGYGRMVFFWGGLAYLICGPFFGIALGLVGGGVTSFFYLKKK